MQLSKRLQTIKDMYVYKIGMENKTVKEQNLRKDRQKTCSDGRRFTRCHRNKTELLGVLAH